MMKTEGLMAILLLKACFIVSFGASLPDNRNCPETEKTMQRVTVCPKTHEEWTKASDEMECSSINQTCTEKQSKFLFHCIKGEDGFLYHVCAVLKQAVGGFCLGYSFEGQRLEENITVKCTNFTTNRCPYTYLSTIIYKFPGCYEGTKMTKTLENDVYDIETSTPVTLTPCNDTCMQNSTYGREDENNKLVVHIGAVTGVLFPSGIIVLIGYVFYRKSKRSELHSEPTRQATPRQHLPWFRFYMWCLKNPEETEKPHEACLL